MTTNAKTYTISVSKLRPFENHSYKVQDDAEMEQLIESVKENGVMTPLVIRSVGNDMYEVISGHRRLHAAEKAGLQSVPG